MALLKRLGLYFIGLAIGLIFLVYFLNEKNAEFCYSPNCRVLKNIRAKPLEFSPEAYQFTRNNTIDSLQLSNILTEGNVAFSKSTPRSKPCGSYIIEAKIKKKAIAVAIKNCDTFARIEKIEFIR